MMDAATNQRSNRQHRKKQTLITAVVACTIALVVGLTEFGLKRRQQREQQRKEFELILNKIKVPCQFLGFKYDFDLKICYERTEFYRLYGVISTIPSEIGLLTRMTSLDIYGDTVFGTIPSTMGRLTKLKYLRIEDSQLNGTFPSALENLTQLEWLSLKNNHFSGTIPSTLGALVNIIQFLDLSFNQLTGTFNS